MLRKGSPTSLREMNVVNRAQWKFWTAEFEAKMRDPEILAEAVKDLEANAKVPTMALRLSFEDALRGAEARVMCRRRVPSAASRGGRAPLEDYLQEEIIEIVRLHPLITQGELLRELEKSESVTVKRESVSGHPRTIISFTTRKNTSVTVSSIKDRLFRARRKIYSL
jgi:hypothetical protein